MKVLLGIKKKSEMREDNIHTHIFVTSESLATLTSVQVQKESSFKSIQKQVRFLTNINECCNLMILEPENFEETTKEEE